MFFKRGDAGGWFRETETYFLNFQPLDFLSEWLPWKRKGYNWREFYLIKISWESDDIFPGWEFDFILLGLGIHVRYTDKTIENEHTEYMDRAMAEFKARECPLDGADWGEGLSMDEVLLRMGAQ
jgi:hypothetical protein